MECEDIVRELTELRERSDNNMSQINDIKADIKEIKDNNKILFTLAESVKTVVSELTSIKSDIKGMRVEIDGVKLQPITKKAAITDKLIGIVCGVFGTGIVVFILNNMFPNIFK